LTELYRGGFENPSRILRDY